MPDVEDDAPPQLAQLRTSAWCGMAIGAATTDAFITWGGQRGVDQVAPRQPLGAISDRADWTDETVGWGLILPDNLSIPADRRWTADDAPECIRELVRVRKAPVLRYDAKLGDRHLKRYDRHGVDADLRTAGARGVKADAIPWYLLIVGSPQQIPWSFQYRLQTEAYVGRLDLDAEALDRYVAALIRDWSGSAPKRDRPVLWGVDHGAPDITRLMRRTILDRLRDALARSQPDVTAGTLVDAHATTRNLVAALADRSPAFVATTSHGATFPLEDTATLRSQLGALVDADQQLLDPTQLLADWSPAGAIWYAHACCSAGCDGSSSFKGVAAEGTPLANVLLALERAGPLSAPLPRALLGAPQPARAFIGHVEPTFDWTLRDPATKQVTTERIISSLYDELHADSRPPVGYALQEYHRSVAGALHDYASALEGLSNHTTDITTVARAKLIARDMQSMVLLGDPTVRLA